MGRPQKQFKQLTNSESLALAEQDLQAGKSKEALNRALSCFKSVPGAEQRSLLERAYVARIRELATNGVEDRALERFYELMQLEPQHPEVVAALPALRVQLGIGSQADQAAVLETTPEVATELVIGLADRAVLRNQPGLAAGLQSEVEKVHAALKAVEEGKDSQAEELVKDIARSSPLADWRLFLRGLSAFYQRDLERTQANWDRLAPNRPARRIAETLLVANGYKPAQKQSVDVTTSVRRFKNGVPKNSWAEDLKRLADTWKANRWRDFLYGLRDLKQRGGPERIQLLNELAERAWRRFARQGRHRELEKLASIAPAPAQDPHWNRAKALASEQDKDSDLDTIHDRWRKFLEDVQHDVVLKDSERPLVTALIYRHLGRVCARRMVECEHHFFGRRETVNKMTLDRAAQNFKASVKACPTLRQTYLDWMELHERLHESDRVADVSKRFVKACPDEWETHDWLTSYYLAEDEAHLAEPHVKELMRLRPRDERTHIQRWNHQVSAIRIWTKQRIFAPARAAAAELEALVTNPDERLYYDLIRASVEYKAKNLTAAEEFVAKAVAQVPEPTIVWMILSSNIAKYGIDPAVKKVVNARLTEGLARPATSDTAGRIAKYLLSQTGNSRRYTGQATHIRLAIKYIEQYKNVRWLEHDLRVVCEFVMNARRADRFTDDLLQFGEALFPNDPFYPAKIGLLETGYGMFGCDPPAIIKKLERALELNQSARVPLTDKDLQAVQKELAVLKETMKRFRMFDESEEEEDLEDEGFDDEDDDFEEDDEDFDDEDDEDETEADVGNAPQVAGPRGRTMEELSPYERATVRVFLNKCTGEAREELEGRAALLGLTLEALVLKVMKFV